MMERYEPLLVLGSGVSIMTILLLLEYKRINKSHLFIRLFAVFALTLAGFGLFIPFSFPWQDSIPSSKSEPHLLLTEGFGINELRKFKSPVLYTFDEGINKAFPGSILLKNPSSRGLYLSNDKNLKVLGYGLNESELESLESIPFAFYPSPLPVGISSCYWNPEIKQGQPFFTQGQIYNPEEKPLKLLLKGTGIPLDSCFLPKKKWSTFQLKTIPKLSGANLYQVILLDQKDTIEKEPLPFFVQKFIPLKISVLSSSPNFETKFLMRWIQKKGDFLKARTLISKSKVSAIQSDPSDGTLDILNPKSLEQSDLLIADHSALDQMNTGQSEVIRKAVSLGGLSLFVRIDTLIGRSAWYDKGFILRKKTVNEPGLQSLYFHLSNDKTRPLTLDRFYLAPQPDQQTLLQSEDKLIRSGLRLYGQGRILWTTLNKTYEWALKGDSDQYNAYWSNLISSSIRRSFMPEFFTARNQTPRIHQRLVLQTIGNSPPKLTGPILHSSARQNEQVPFLWTEMLWPENIGWQEPFSKENSQRTYIYNSGDWHNLDLIKKISLTREKANQNLLASNNLVGNQNGTRSTIPKLFFYLVILGACSYLWIENKLQEN